MLQSRPPPPSSSGPGRGPLKAETGVRNPVGAPCHPPAQRGRCRYSDWIGMLSVGSPSRCMRKDRVRCHKHESGRRLAELGKRTTGPQLPRGENRIYTGSAQFPLEGRGECHPTWTIRGLAVHTQQTHGGRLTGDHWSPARHSSLGCAWYGGYLWMPWIRWLWRTNSTTG